MRIIDLDNPEPIQKPDPITVIEVKRVEKVEKPADPIVTEVALPAKKEKLPTDEKERILAKLDEEDRYVRYQRAMNHRRFFDQLGPDLLPIKGADFSDIYEEQRVYRDRLKSIYLKKEQLQRTGSIHQPRLLTDADLAKLGALKHERSNAYKNASKIKKKIEQAKIKDNPVRINSLDQKLQEIELKIVQLSHEIEKITKDGMVTR